jgi:hypothetical protein
LPIICLCLKQQRFNCFVSPLFYHKPAKALSFFLLFTFSFLLYNIVAGQFKETDGEGITHITVVGDIAGAVLADSVSGACFVADCLAFVDSVSCCGYSRGGVSCDD